MVDAWHGHKHESNLLEDVKLGLVRVVDKGSNSYFERDVWASLKHPKYKDRKW